FALPYEAYIAYEALVEEIYVPEPVIPMFPDVDMSLYEIDFSQVQYGDYYEVQSDELEYVDVSNSDDGFNFIRLNEIRPTVNRATRSGVARLNVTLHDITLSVELNNLATEPIQLPAPSDLAINGTILTWVGVATTWSYQIYVNGEPTGGLVSENTFDLATLNLSTASYEIRVRAIGDDILHLDSELSEAVIFNSESNLARLTAPIGLAITTNSVLTWNAVLQATAYRVYVNGNPHDSTVTSTSFDLASLGLSPGNHQIRVRALGNGSDILDSLLSETVIFTISGIPTTLTAPTGLAIANSLLTWNAVPQATAYRVYINGNPHGITAIATTFNLNTLGLSEGSYEISVRALGNGVNILDSALSNAITFAVAPQPPAESGAGGGWASVMQTPPPAQTPPTQTPPPAWRPNPTPPLSTPMFDDINPQAWYADYVEVVTSMGIFHGVSSSQFAPSSNMTRAMFVQVLANLNGVNTLDFTARPQNFNDVSRNAWYFGAVKWASENGIVVGIGDGNFAPNQSITREEMAVMLYRFIEFVQLELPTGARRTFVDQGSISSWATEAVTTIQAMGIIMGRPDGTFDPQATATRAEVAAIFARFIYIVE
ncbi:MAG: S-layer homology domain-containing protein, partial [Defluviitaleaceae bacterium]|nr:S-layer homology domain-containing protein [Defluviitaleaceae bacterium]